MENNTAPWRLLISWILIAIGVYVYYQYEDMGLIFAAIPIGLAGSIRRHHDKLLRDRLFSNNTWKFFMAAYYLSTSIIAFFWYTELASANAITLFVLIAFPFVPAIVINDILTCIGRGRLNSQK